MRLQKRAFGMLIVLLLLTMTAIGQIYPEMILVEGGTFTMGSYSGDDDEEPTHRVTLDGFQIGKYPVTVGQYRAFVEATGRSMPDAPDWGWQDKHPMVIVNYNDAVAYCNWLGEKYGGDWRLPTEAQWEYAARGGNKSRGYTYAGGNNLWDVAWYADNAGGQTQSVGRKKANELGIHDMTGNVWEWCRDWYDKDYYSNSPSANPRGPSSGSLRVLRGGSWYLPAKYCRVAIRGYSAPSDRRYDGGFRVVLSPLTMTAIGQAPASIPEKPEMIRVEGGTFTMGSNSGYDNEKPTHQVTLDGFQIGKYPVTVGQYKAFVEATGRSMPDAPSWGWQDKHPMVMVNYNDAVAYCNWLGEKYGGDWRLPTEAQWEYAARGGQKSRGYTYAGGNNLWDVAWYRDNSGYRTHAVGTKKANELGIHDMSGNVYEWCRDWYDEDYYSNSPSTNPRGPSSGSNRVLRGGCWYDSAAFCRVAIRSYAPPSYRITNSGFRVVLSQ